MTRGRGRAGDRWAISFGQRASEHEPRWQRCITVVAAWGEGSHRSWVLRIAGRLLVLTRREPERFVVLDDPTPTSKVVRPYVRRWDL